MFLIYAIAHSRENEGEKMFKIYQAQVIVTLLLKYRVKL